MSTFIRDYHEAYEYASKRTRDVGMPHGIEKANEYGRAGFLVFMLPKDPAKRFGHELRCEVVEIGAPIILARQVSLDREAS